jgi:hypothetical protein
MEGDIRYALDQDRIVIAVDTGNLNAGARRMDYRAVDKASVFRTLADVLGLRRSHPPARLDRPPLRSLDLPETAKTLSPGFHQLAAYNRDMPKCLITVTPTALKLANEHFSKFVDSGSALNSVLPHFVRADQLALHYGAKHRRVSQWLFWLGAAAVTIVVVQATLFQHAHWFLLFEILDLTSAVVYYLHSMREAWHEKWLNDRYLAEALRQVLFASLLGPPPVTHLPPQPAYPFYKGPATWLLDVPRRIERELAAQETPAVTFEGLRDFLLGAWIDDQLDHHSKTAAKYRHLEHIYHLRGRAASYAVSRRSR